MHIHYNAPPPHTTPQVTSLCMSPKNDTFISTSVDKTVRLWDLRTPTCQGLLELECQATAAYDQQGLVFAVGAEAGIIKLYDARCVAVKVCVLVWVCLCGCVGVWVWVWVYMQKQQ